MKRFMLRFLRPRWIALVLLVCVLVGGAGLLVRRWRSRQFMFYKKGELHLKADNSEQAAEMFRRALELDPDFQEAQLGLARALAVGRKFDEADAAIEKAVAMGFGPADAAVMRARLIYSLQADHRIAAAGNALTEQLCDAVLAEQVEPALALVAGHAEQTESPAEAHVTLGKLYEQKTQILAAKWRLSLRAKEDALTAGDVEAADSMQRRADAALQLAEPARRSAEAAYERACEEDPKLPEPRLALAGYELRSYVPDPERVRTLLEPLVEQDPEARAVRLQLADAERLAGDYDRALEHIDAVPPRTKFDYDLELARAQVLVAAERWDEADDACRELVRENARDNAAAYLMGKVLMNAGEFDLAANYLQNIFDRSRQPWAQARFDLATSLRAAGKTEQAIATFRKALEDVSKGLAAVTRVRVTGRHPGQQLRDIEYGSALALAEELEEGSPALAADYYIRAFRVFPDRAELFERTMAACRAAGVEPEKVEGVIVVRGAALAAHGDLDAALLLCRDYVDSHPRSPRVWSALGELRAGKARALAPKLLELRRLADAAQQAADTAEAESMGADAARLMTRIKDLRNGAVEAYQRSMALDPGFAPPRLALAWRAATGQTPEPERARELIRPILQREPDAAPALLMMARVDRIDGRYDDALEHLRALPERYRDSGEALAERAQILVAARRWDEAEATCRALAAARPDDVVAAFLSGVVLLEQGRADEAVGQLERVFAGRELSWAQARYALARALRAAAQPKRAAEAFVQVLADVPVALVTGTYLPLSGTGAGADLMEMEHASCLALAEALKAEAPKRAAEYAVRAFKVFPARGDDFAAALAACRAAGLAQEAEEVVNLHAVVLDAAGDVEGALAVCDEYIRGQVRPSSKLLLLRARLGVNRLVKDGEFDAADLAIEQAVQAGLGQTEAAFLRADVLSRRARQRVPTLATDMDVGLCDSIIADQLDPALVLITAHAEGAPQPATAHFALGELLATKARLLGMKWHSLRRELKAARGADEEEKVEELAAAAREAFAEMALVQQRSSAAYRHSIRLDEQLPAPRLALARHLLAAYAPRPDIARAILEPIVVSKPKHRAARLLLAETERLAGNYNRSLAHLGEITPPGDDDYGVRLARGKVLVVAERWAEAETLCRELARERPRDLTALYLLGKTLSRTGHAAEAAGYLQTIFAIADRPWPAARFELGKVLQLSGKRAESLAAFRKALQEVQDALITSQEAVAELLEIQYGSLLAIANELRWADSANAAKMAMAALQLFPDRAAAFDSAMKAGQAAGAPAEEIERAIILHAAAIAAQGDLEAALQLCRARTAEVGAESRDLRLLRARLLVRQGVYGQAADLYQALWDESKDNTAGHELAALGARLGWYARARKIYEELLAAEPTDVRALGGLVGVLTRSGDDAAARQVLARAEGESGSEAVRALLLRFALREGKLDEAVALARSYAGAAPDDGDGRARLADLLWRAGKPQEARAEFLRAIELAPRLMAGYRLGLLELQLGRPDEAISVFTKCLGQFPDGAWAKIHLAIALQAAGRAEEGVGVLQDVCDVGAAPAVRSGVPQWYLAVMQAGLADLADALLRNDLIRGTAVGPAGDRAALLARLAALDEDVRGAAAAALNVVAALGDAGALEPLDAEFAELEKLLPREPLPGCWRVRALARTGRSDIALDECRALVKEHPDFTFARQVLAEIHVVRGETDEARCSSTWASSTRGRGSSGPLRHSTGRRRSIRPRRPWPAITWPGCWPRASTIPKEHCPWPREPWNWAARRPRCSTPSAGSTT